MSPQQQEEEAKAPGAAAVGCRGTVPVCCHRGNWVRGLDAAPAASAARQRASGGRAARHYALRYREVKVESRRQRAEGQRLLCFTARAVARVLRVATAPV